MSLQGRNKVGKWVVKVGGKVGKEFSRKKYSKVRNAAGGVVEGRLVRKVN
jgi:hypothetical protein